MYYNKEKSIIALYKIAFLRLIYGIITSAISYQDKEFLDYIISILNTVKSIWFLGLCNFMAFFHI